jgi:phenylacetyl-CoA:acceptor oxidoreductase 26-kDa subunit
MSRLQENWDARAALNFMLGGTGAGLMLAAALFLRETAWPAAAALLLVAAGLGAVWLEIGRKLRALHVFFNPFASWMSRESFAAVLLFGLGGIGAFEPAFLPAAALAALAFLYCQARILRAAKGIPAWRAPEVVPLVVSTGLAEGFGLALLFDAGAPLLGAFALAVAARAFAWMRYRAAVKAPALADAGANLLRLGTAAALALAAAAWAIAGLAPLAGLAALAAGWQLKFCLVTRASFKQPIVLPRLPVRGTR